MADDGDDVVRSDGVVALRPWRRADAPFLVEARRDPAIRRYSAAHDAEGWPLPPPSLAETQASIDAFAQRWQSFAGTGSPTGVAFAVTDDRVGEPVGLCGVDAWSPGDVAQIGYWLAPRARGGGRATRAAVLLTRWLFDLGAAEVFLTVVAGNDASAAVARRAGFRHEATLPDQALWKGERHDVLRFTAIRGAWPPADGPGHT